MSEENSFNCEEALASLYNWEWGFQIDENTGQRQFSNPKEYYQLLGDLFIESHKQVFFWEHCSFTVYKEKFEERFRNYREGYFDAELLDFINKELEELQGIDVCYFEYNRFNDPYQPREQGYSNLRVSSNEDWAYEKIEINSAYAVSYYDKLEMAINKKRDFLIEMKGSKELPRPQIEKLNFKGSQVEFIELVKALKEKGCFDENQNVVIDRMSNFFNIDIGKKPNLIIQDIKKRNNQTKFLTELTNSLYDSFNKN